MANRLQFAKSPYLQQHAANPVDWFPWEEAAFEQANRENKPIFLSIGYATCHWCHVMARESFSNTQIAQILNRYFISIKVDKEERPDLDQIYMTICQALTGSGGWPLNLI
ncbi:MAG: thioredoxin domain-containing protein, partial [Clostridia bacterium]|nr:thioredoxin domain-containing protein [Clostridia bacterium]